MRKINYLLSLGLITVLFFASSCGNDDDAPAPENEEEIIDLVRLIFTPVTGGASITVEATDPDGAGPQDFVTPAIVLSANTLYNLSIEVENTEAGEDITEEIEEEGDEHQFFFGWSGALFKSPTGLGNIGSDSQNNSLNYDDEDINNLPIGLTTLWETSEAAVSGTFTVLLKHQPGIKSATSSSTDGETDIDITWDIEIL